MTGIYLVDRVNGGSKNAQKSSVLLIIYINPVYFYHDWDPIWDKKRLLRFIGTSTGTVSKI